MSARPTPTPTSSRPTKAYAPCTSRATSRSRMATDRTSPRVGFVGLGIMGLPMARNARKAGFPLSVTNRTLARADSLKDLGATVVTTPREVAERSDIVVTMVTNAPEVEAVTFGPAGIAEGTHDGLLLVDMSSISPVASRDMAERAAAKGFKTLDAPVSGGEIGAIEARLSIMVGGDAADVERARAVFEALGKTIVHIGGHRGGPGRKTPNTDAAPIHNHR